MHTHITQACLWLPHLSLHRFIYHFHWLPDNSSPDLDFISINSNRPKHTYVETVQYTEVGMVLIHGCDVKTDVL